MRNEQDPTDQQTGNENYNTGNYRQGYQPYDQQSAPYAFNVHPMQDGSTYPAVMSGTSQQGQPVYAWQNQTVPSQAGPNPAGLMHSHTYSNNTIPFGNGGHPDARTQPMLTQATGMLPQHMPQNLGMPGTSGGHHGMQMSSNPSQSGGVGIYQCPQCPSQFDRLGRFEAHMNAHHNVRPYVCDRSCGASDCTMSFTSAEALGSHKRKDRVQCENCGNLVAKKNMARHSKAHCPSLF